MGWIGNDGHSKMTRTTTCSHPPPHAKIARICCFQPPPPSPFRTQRVANVQYFQPVVAEAMFTPHELDGVPPEVILLALDFVQSIDVTRPWVRTIPTTIVVTVDDLSDPIIEQFRRSPPIGNVHWVLHLSSMDEAWLTAVLQPRSPLLSVVIGWQLYGQPIPAEIEEFLLMPLFR